MPRVDPTRDRRGSAAPRASRPGTTELGIDIIKVDRIRAAHRQFGERFSKRVLTPSEQRYVREPARDVRRALGRQGGRLARCSASASAASAGATSRSSGCRPASRRSASTAGPRQRAEQLGMDRIAVSITHESDYAVAIAFGVRTAGGRYVFPLDIEDRLDDRERRLLARIERLRALHEARPGRLAGDAETPGRTTMTDAAGRASGGATDGAAAPAVADGRARTARRRSTTRSPRRCSRTAEARPQGLVRQAARDRRLARLRGRRAARLPRGRPGRRRLVTLAVPESLQPLFAAKVVEATTMALPEDDVEEIDPEPALARILDHDHDAIVVGPGLRPGLATAELVRELLAVPATMRRRSCSTPRRFVARHHGGLVGGRSSTGRPDAPRGRVRNPSIIRAASWRRRLKRRSTAPWTRRRAGWKAAATARVAAATTRLESWPSSRPRPRAMAA